MSQESAAYSLNCMRRQLDEVNKKRVAAGIPAIAYNWPFLCEQIGMTPDEVDKHAPRPCPYPDPTPEEIEKNCAYIKWYLARAKQMEELGKRLAQSERVAKVPGHPADCGEEIYAALERLGDIVRLRAEMDHLEGMEHAPEPVEMPTQANS